MEPETSMKNALFVSHLDFSPLLERVAQKATVWVPGPDPNAPHIVAFRPFRSDSVPDFRRLPTLSAKGVVFPQAETLLRFQKDKGESPMVPATLTIEDIRHAPDTVLLGCRPCDVRGLLVLDAAFLHGPAVDPYYQARREKTVVVSMVCLDADAACFCSAVGSHPADTEGSDAQMIPVHDGYVLHVLSEKGEKLFQGVGRPASALEQEEAQRVRKSARQMLVGDKSLTESARRFSERFSDAAFWRMQTERCLSCGACTFVCPTCSCFTMTDESDGLRGERLRSWDSCMFSHFTQEASGHNPRPSKAERFRNRVGHKFSYFPAKHGRIACCGCGRCLRHCPAAMDIRAIIREMAYSEDIHA